MNYFKNFVKNNFLFIAVLIIWAFLVYKNFTPNTWLTGWDNLHPEFNNALNLKRAFQSSWQEYFGLGFEGGMAHAADIPRQIIIWIASIFIPASIIRYSWTFAVLLVGPLGVFVLGKWLGSEKSNFEKQSIGVIGSFVYLLNLATVQYFFTPFETFINFFGFLPWIIWVPLKYLKEGGKKNLILVAILAILSSPAFYVQTMFVVFLIILTPFLIESIIREKKKGLIKTFRLLLVWILVSSYWLFPVAMFTLGRSQVVSEAKINTLATPDTKLMNDSAGNLNDILRLKGFWLDYTDLNKEGKFDYLYPSSWRQHLSSVPVKVIQYFVSGFSILSVIVLILKKKMFALSIAVSISISILMLTGIKLPFEILNQIFRSPFTKWSVALSFCFTFAILLGISNISLKSKKTKNIFISLITLIFLSISVISVYPVFDGNLISEKMRVSIPQEYFNAMNFLNSPENQTRIAYMPVQTFWGWNFYDWGYRGSGFIWYGLRDPIMDRAYDVWSSENETYYHEVSYAVYKNDPNLLSSVFEKYNISRVLIDDHVIIPLQDKTGLKIDQIKDLLEKIGAEKKWSEGKLEIYELSNQKQFVSSSDNLMSIQENQKFSKFDSAYHIYGNYKNQTDELSLYFPFSYFSKEEIGNITKNKENELTLSVNNIEKSKLTIPALEDNQNVIYSFKVSNSNNQIDLNSNPLAQVVDSNKDLIDIKKFLPINIKQIGVGNGLVVGINNSYTNIIDGVETSLKNVELKVGDAFNVSLYNLEKEEIKGIENQFENTQMFKCWEKSLGLGEVKDVKENGIWSIETKDAVGCTSLSIGEVGDGLLTVSLPFKSTTNKSRPDFCIVEQGKNDCLNSEVFYSSDPSNEWTHIERSIKSKKGIIYWLVLSARPADSDVPSWKIEYKAPQVSIQKLQKEYLVGAESWLDLKKEDSVELNGISSVKIFSNPINFNFAQKGKRSENENCDLFKRGEVSKQIVANGVIYSASNMGTSCDYMLLSGIKPENEYLLEVTGSGHTGRAAKLYLSNKATNRNDLEVLLGTGNYTKFFTLPSWGQNIGDYVLNIESRSFGPEKAVNKIENINIYPLPINWLSKWQISKNNSNKFNLDLSSASSKNTQLKTISFTKKGISVYKLHFDVDTKTNIVLSQSYDPGWVAFQNGKFLNHFKVNGWANGWESQGAGAVTIFFWPQLLQYLGFVLLLTPFLYVVICYIIDKRS